MKVSFEVNEKHFLFLVGLLAVVSAVGIVTGYGGTQPSVMGHTPGEINPGTFGGSSGDVWVFPGRVGINHANPGSRLDVVGNVGINGVLTVSNGDVRSPNTPKAWVNFDGSTTPITIRGSYGISNIERISTGIYRITWSTPFSGNGYAVTGTCNALSYSGANLVIEAGTGDYEYRAESATVGCRDANNNNKNSNFVTLVAYGEQ